RHACCDGKGRLSVQATVGAWPAARAVVIADVDGDGRTDLIGVDEHGQLQASGNENGRFGTGKPLGIAWHAGDQIASADLNGDGKTDLVDIDEKADMGSYLN